MIDDKKDLEINQSSESELDLGYGNTSSIGEESRTSLHYETFETLSKEEVDLEETERVQVEEVEMVEELEDEENEEDEKISEESVDEVVIIVENDEDDEEEYETSESNVEVTSIVDEDIKVPSLEMEEGAEEVEKELDEYGNTIEVFAVQGRSNSNINTRVSQLTLGDGRLEKNSDGKAESSGTISHFGETKGGVDFGFKPTAIDISTRYSFQGTAKACFRFSGDILKAQIGIPTYKCEEDTGVYKIKENTDMKLISLSTLLVEAANERIEDINDRASLNGTPDKAFENLKKRYRLYMALNYLLSANNEVPYKAAGTDPSTDPEVKAIPALELTFRELGAISPSQVTLKFDTHNIFPFDLNDDDLWDNVKNNSRIRYIIDEKSFVINPSGLARTEASTLQISPETIAVNMEINAGTSGIGLGTNKRYEFIGPNKDFIYFTLIDDIANFDAKEGKGTVKYLEGIAMTAFSTAKKTPSFEVYTVELDGNDAKLSLKHPYIGLEKNVEKKYNGDNNQNWNQDGSNLVRNINFSQIDDTTYIDYPNLTSTTTKIYRDALDIRGTSIKFKTLVITDEDKTITKVEIEDTRKEKYPVSLSPVKPEDTKNMEYHPQVTGLQRSMSYTFEKLHITAQLGSELIKKTFEFKDFSKCFTNGSTAGVDTPVDPHKIDLRTVTFTEPRMSIEFDKTKRYVDKAQGKYVNAPGQNVVEVFVPNLEVELPNKTKVPAVKNDKNSLRYVIKVETLDAILRDLTVNGLRGNERANIERIDGKDEVYFIVTLSELTEKWDYGFLILELNYTDLDGRDLVTRQALNALNRTTIVNIETAGEHFPKTGNTQVPDETLDNTTGPELSGTDLFNVKLFDPKTLEARKAEIPVFIDDINGRFLRMDFVKSESNPEVDVQLEGSLLKFTNLKPKTEAVYKLDFVWQDKDSKEQILSKYVKIKTEPIPPVDVKDTTITTTTTTAEIVFELFSQPKSSISAVSLSDNKIKFTWNRDKLTLNLEELKSNTDYKDLEITFKLENGLTSKYKIKPFKTKQEIAPPTGPAAEFVGRIYEAALSRKPEVEGWKFWTQKLESKELSVTQFIHDLMAQDEFVNKFMSKEDFIKMMYVIIVGREPEEEGQIYWGKKYDEYKLQESSLADLRRRIAAEMMNEQEFKDYVNKIGLKY